MLTISSRVQRTQARCALCHDDLAADSKTCEGCGTLLHEECAEGLLACPTLGCKVAPSPASERAAVRFASFVAGSIVASVAAGLLGSAFGAAGLTGLVVCTLVFFLVAPLVYAVARCPGDRPVVALQTVVYQAIWVPLTIVPSLVAFVFLSPVIACALIALVAVLEVALVTYTVVRGSHEERSPALG